MIKIKPMFDDIKYKISVEIIKTLKNKGFEAFFAGGCVRDYLMGLTPSDYDIATSAKPEEIEKIFEKTIPVGKEFGVMIVVKQNINFQIATFRINGPYSDSRRPDYVLFSDYKQDVKRRDFTINGLLYDPLENKIIDLVGGQKDIAKKIIRTIGNPTNRFKEDKLRMIRAIRFACELDFTIEKNTRDTIKKLSNLIKDVSWERIRDELKRILVSKKRKEGIKMLEELGLLQYILPELANTRGVAQPSPYHPEGDVFEHTLLCLEYLKDPSFEVALATLLHDIGKPATFQITDRIRFTKHEVKGEEITEEICRRLKLSNQQIEMICWLVKNHLRFKDIPNMRPSTLKRFVREQYFDKLLELCYADIKASCGDLSIYNMAVEANKKLKEEEKKTPRIITGHDLIALGLTPGPIFSQILKEIEDMQLEGSIKNKNQALDFIKKKYLS